MSLRIFGGGVLRLPAAAFAIFVAPVLAAILLPVGSIHGLRHSVAVPGTSPVDQPPDRPSRGALTSGVWAVTNVHVIPMTSDTIIRDATVLVRDGRVAVLGPAGAVEVPDGARRIDGAGRYRMPGPDMHTHLYSDGPVPDSAGPAELGVMLAHGITAVRLMIGTPEHLALRRQVEQGTIIGPQLWVASPHFTNEASDNARVVTSPAEVRAAACAAP